MSRNIYSFIKIEKRQTKKGIYATIAGIFSLLCLIGLAIFSFVKAGELPKYIGGIGYISFAVCGVAFWQAFRLRQDSEAYGKMIGSAFYVNLIAVIVHALIFIAGCLTIIS